jgi:uncharacterized protein (UPF0548 family)
MEPLPAARVAALRAAPFTYAPVGGTATLGAAPAGYAWLRRTTVVGCGFDEAVEQLMTWGVHERAGLRVRASADRVAVDEVVELRIPWLPGLRIPCRVVRVTASPDEVGFAYGTLPGHPESGEESFVVSRTGGRVDFTITAFSHPATWSARAAAPLARRGQELFTRRYLAALRTA